MWAKAAGGAGWDWVADVVEAPNGDVLITGRFDQDITFGAGESHETVLHKSGPGQFEMFVARLAAADGTLMWARQAEG
ncbi:MAG: hypothetical protein HYV63_28090 [Candidatus Schekmanbacteria bacterium]|nr:hypothetical protein [Candidatus Schekmanbacteria bacterium]